MNVTGIDKDIIWVLVNSLCKVFINVNNHLDAVFWWTELKSSNYMLTPSKLCVNIILDIYSACIIGSAFF